MLKLSNKETKKCVKNATSTSILYSDGNNGKTHSCQQQNHYLLENTSLQQCYWSYSDD